MPVLPSNPAPGQYLRVNPCRAPSHAPRWLWMACLQGVLLLGLACPLAAAESTPIPLEHEFIVRGWRTENGLPDDRVLSLLVDRHGLLWVGTRKGVSRFDGRRFTTWSRSTHKVFVSEECRALTEDRDGILWVGTTDGLIQLTDPPVRYEPRDVCPQWVRSPDSLSKEIWSLHATDAGELFAGTGTGMLVRAPDGAWGRPDVADQSRIGPFTSFATSPDGAAWAGTFAQLFRSERPGGSWTQELDGGESATTNFVHGLALAPSGVPCALVGSRPLGIGRLYRRDGPDWTLLSNRSFKNFSQPLFLVADTQGGLWFPTTGPEVGHWHNGQLTEYSLPAAMSGDVFLCMIRDAEGNLWAGTSRSGLLCLQPRRVRTLAPADGLPDPKTRALIESSDGALWVGTDGGVARLNGPERLVFTQASGLASDRVRALTEDSLGHVWIGTGAGLDRWDGLQLHPVEYQGQKHRTKIRALHAGRDGAVWVGTAQGLYRFRSDQTNAWLVADGLPHENVCAILEDHQQRVWIGTDGGGLARLTDDGFERFDESRGLSSLRVWALHEDADGGLWIGTDRGLNVLRGGRISTLTTAHGLPDNLVNGIAEDRHGWLWIGHDRGIYRVNRRNLIEVADGSLPKVRCISYTEPDGLLNPETNGQISYPPVVRLRDGRIAFATMGGVALFDPGALPDLTNGPPAHVEELRAGGQTQFANRPGLVPAGSLRNEAGAIRIDAQHRSYVEVQFSAAAFRAPDQVRFRHRLLGLSPDWVDAGAMRQASYLNLRPGDYTFEVTAANHHGYPSAAPARLPFRIEPVWHERLGVRLAGALSLLALGAGVARWRVRELRRLGDLEQQAALATQRARLAKDLHDGLGANLTELTLLSGLGESQPLTREALASRFDRLTRSTHEALHSLRDLIWATNPKADSLEVLVSRVCETADRTLEAAGLACRLDFPADLPAVALGPDFRKDLLFAANEALNNAVRHAQARQVTLRLSLAGSQLVLEIADDGCGFVVDEAERRTRGADHGLGLASLRERLAAQGGTCEIRSQPGQGTQVTFRVPLPR